VKRLALVVLAVFTACAVIRPTPGGGYTIQPATAQADPGRAIKFVLAAASGAPPDVTWSASGGSMAPDGTFTAPGCTSALPMAVTITATAGGSVVSTTLTVEDRVTGISISPAAVTVAPGQTQKFTATVRTVCVPGGTQTAMRVQRSSK
jgi:plastocyanin